MPCRILKTPGGDREMVEILALVLQHDEQAVLAAVELALEAGAPTKTHILNLLHRLVDGKPIDPLPVNPPNALTLTTEPQANVGRYDALRKGQSTEVLEAPARPGRKRLHLDSKGPQHRIVFLVDEVGQFIGTDSHLMLNLQTIVEELGTLSRRRAWVIVTSRT